MQFSGVAGTSYRIEYADGVNAQSCTNIVAGTGPLLVIDADPPQKQRRFYRAVEVSR
jgi:hypothetical protein